jgi:hypothetical protein
MDLKEVSHGLCQDHLWMGVDRKFAYELTFKPLKNIFTDCPRVFKIEHISVNIILIFGINIGIFPSIFNLDFFQKFRGENRCLASPLLFRCP